MLTRNQDTNEKLRKMFYEKGNVLEGTIERINEIRGEVVEKIGFVPRFVIQQKAERFMPRFDLFDDGEEYHIGIELPGLSGEAVEVTTTEESLRVAGNQITRRDDGKILFLEQLTGHFSRTLHFADPVDSAKGKATLSRGVLWVILPKAHSMKDGQTETRIPVEEQ